MRHAYLSILFACALALFGLASPATAAQETSIEGTLARTVEAGGWVVQTGSGEYLILNANRYEKESWFHEGARVAARGETKPDTPTIHMQGTPFVASSMQPVDGDNARRDDSVRGPCDESVVVTYGDTLYSIAQRCGTSVSAILAANARIANPNRIYIGQELAMPGAGDDFRDAPSYRPGDREVSLSPLSGAPGAPVRVIASGFEPHAEVAIGIGPMDSEYEVVDRARTDARGSLTAEVEVPGHARPGSNWVVVVTKGHGPDRIKKMSEPFTVKSRTGDLRTDYVVQPGDTLYRIAVRHGTNVAAIVSENPNITNPNVIEVGQRIEIP